MTKWEYTGFWVKAEGIGQGPDIAKMNEMGSKGWKAIFVENQKSYTDQVNFEDGYYCLFIREKTK